MAKFAFLCKFEVLDQGTEWAHFPQSFNMSDSVEDKTWKEILTEWLSVEQEAAGPL